MATANETDADLGRQRTQLAITARQLELDLFWKRATFFWLFIASAFVGLTTTHDKHPLICMAVVGFGFVGSLCWTLLNRGSKFWYEAWEHVLGNSPLGPVFDEARDAPPKHWWWSTRFSVSKLAIMLSDYVVLLWASIMIYEWSQLWFDWRAWALLIAPLAFVVAAMIFSKGGRRDQTLG